MTRYTNTESKMIKLKDLLNEAPRDLHFKGVKRKGPSFREVILRTAAAADRLARRIQDTNTPAFADSDRDPYSPKKEAAVIHAMGKFQNEISTLSREWEHLQSKHGI